MNMWAVVQKSCVFCVRVATVGFLVIEQRTSVDMRCFVWSTMRRMVRILQRTYTCRVESIRVNVVFWHTRSQVRVSCR